MFIVATKKIRSSVCSWPCVFREVWNDRLLVERDSTHALRQFECCLRIHSTAYSFSGTCLRVHGALRHFELSVNAPSDEHRSELRKLTMSSMKDRLYLIATLGDGATASYMPRYSSANASDRPERNERLRRCHLQYEVVQCTARCL